MFFRFQQTANLVTVDSAFAQLVNVAANGDLTFSFSYTVTPSDVINHKARVVALSVISRYVTPPPLLGNTQRGVVDTVAMIHNIRSLLPDAKTTYQQRNKYVLASTNSDIIAYVNNEILQMLQASVSPSAIPQLNVPQLQLVPASKVKQGNNAQPILSRVTNSALVPDVTQQLLTSFLVQPQTLMQDMIVRQGIDPSSIVSLTPRAQSASDTRAGLSNPSQAIELITDPSTQLLNYQLFPATNKSPPTSTDQLLDTDLVQILTTVTSVTTEIPVTVTVPAALLQLENADLTHAFVQFDLLDTASNEPIDTVVSDLNIASALQVYHTPVQPPTVKVAIAPGVSRANLRIQQVDPAATSVQLYKKSIFAATADLDTYTLIGTYNLTVQQQAIQVPVGLPTTSPVIYRVIPVGAQNAQGFEFTNVVVKPQHYSPIKSIALSGTPVDLGIQLEARNIPSNCVAIQFLRWNKTTFQKKYTTVNSDVGFIDAATRAADLITVVDNNVQDNNIYRYVARLIYVDGCTKDMGDVTLQFNTPAPGQVDTTITNLVVNTTATTPDVSFTITTSTTDTDMDVVKQMLSNQDLQQFFQGDLQAQRAQLAQLIAHDVQRVDLTTGLREDFGTITVTNFVDSQFRVNKAINAIQYGHMYRYEIYPLLRATETLFQSTVTTVDPTTHKPYTYSPAKFKHPVALNQGTIVSATGAAQRFGQDPMSFGLVGSVTTVEASFDNATAKIVNQVVTRFNRVLNILSWQVQGDITQVDHFLIMKVVNGIRTTIGKAHAEFTYGHCQYFHPLVPNDNGAISYFIVPVMNDYTVGPGTATNTVIVDVPT